MRTKTIANIFLHKIISRFGVSLKIHTEQSRTFDARLFQKLAHLLGIQKTRSTPLSQQSNGQV